LREALAVWRGPPLADLAYEPFAQAEIGRLEELRLAALEQRIDADLASGRHAEVVGELEALAAEHPLRERVHGQVMLCLYRCGRQAEALAAYQSARRALVDQLGIEPGRELRDLHRSILQQDQGLDLAAAPTARVEIQPGGFVGREVELAALVGGLDDACAGSGRLFMLAGEPGIGKSRLAEELAEHARGRGAKVLIGRCWEAGGAPVYWPWVQALRAHVRETDDDALRAQLSAGAAELAQIVPELRQRVPDLARPSPVEWEGGRVRLFDAAAELLRAAARQRPIVLMLDDLHAADEPSLLLLRFVARELGTIGVLVIGAYRDVAPAPENPLSEALAELSRESIMRRVSLGGLSEPEVAQYLELTASAASSPVLAATLYEKTEGNPLVHRRDRAAARRRSRSLDLARRAATRDSIMPAGPPTARSTCSHMKRRRASSGWGSRRST
jgi:Bacterial transcriptional activator domain/AAA ATPase domain